MGRQWEERERRNNSQPEQNRISKRMVFRRTVILMLICGVGFFIPLAVQLWNISIRDHNFYQQKAAEQQLMDVAVAAHRGDILDANGEVMAMSATVYNLILAPKDLSNSVDKDDFEDEDGKLDQRPPITFTSPPARSGTTPFPLWPLRCLALSTPKGACTAWRPAMRTCSRASPAGWSQGKQRKMWRCTTATPTISTRSTAMT